MADIVTPRDLPNELVSITNDATLFEIYNPDQSRNEKVQMSTLLTYVQAHIETTNLATLTVLGETILARDSGNVGIGTDSPDVELDVRGKNIDLKLIGTNPINHPVINIRHSLGTEGAPLYLGNGDEVGAIAFREGTTTLGNLGGAAINAWATEDWSATNLGTRLQFSTTTTGGTSRNVRMTIGDAGNVGIGIANPDNNLHLKDTNPRLVFEEEGVTAENTKWDFGPNGEAMLFRISNDAYSGFINWLLVQRTANTIDTISFPNGNVGIGTLDPTSILQVVGLPIYANNAAAITGGLTVGAFYRTNADPDPVHVVH